MGRRVIIDWAISSFTGYGVDGLNLALQWSRDASIELVADEPVDFRQIIVDPIRRAALSDFIARSNAFRASGASVGPNDVRLVAMNNEMGSELAPADAARRIGRVVFESHLDAAAVRRARDFPILVLASTWNEQLLRAYGLNDVTTVFQGVDESVFYPGPTSGLLSDRFLVFSGGKVEARKSQDLVIQAFKIFSKRHPDAMLVTLWHSPWPHFARLLDQSGIATPVLFNETGAIDVLKWVAGNGIDPAKVMDLGLIPNFLLPSLLREMDVCLFPNRAEGGTNMVAMECMACGVPAIISKNTGHLDIIREGACYPLERQTPTLWGYQGHGGIGGWSESDLDEIVNALESAYADRAELRRRGVEGAKVISELTWSRTAQRLEQIILDL